MMLCTYMYSKGNAFWLSVQEKLCKNVLKHVIMGDYWPQKYWKAELWDIQCNFCFGSILYVVYCELTVFSVCPVRGGILCKLWKAITDYRQKPTWGLKWRQPLREARTFVPTAQYSPLYLSIYMSKTFRRRTCVRREQLSTRTRNSLTGLVGVFW